MSAPTNLEKFRFYMKDVESPDHFIDWNFYFGISSCLGRRIWINDPWSLFPNLFLTVVADPGVGKSVPAVQLKRILASLVKLKPKDVGEPEIVPLIHLSPDSVTLQALWQCMADATEYIKISDTPKRIYVHSSACFLLAEEMGTLFNEEDARDLVPFFTQAWSCGDFFRKTKTQGEIYLKNMCVNFLGCTQPSWVRRNIKDAMLEEGYAARMLWIYGDKPRQDTVTIRVSPEQQIAIDEVKKHFRELCLLPPTELKLNPIDTPDTWAWMEDWVKNRKNKRLNESKKLNFYYPRKKQHLMKLAIVMHYRDKTTPRLDIEDFEDALRVLELNELTMHLALASGGKNPLSELSDCILKTIDAHNGKCTEKFLRLENWDNGDDEQILKAITFLKDTGQVGIKNVDGKMIHYRIKHNEPQQYTNI